MNEVPDDGKSAPPEPITGDKKTPRFVPLVTQWIILGSVNE